MIQQAKVNIQNYTEAGGIKSLVCFLPTTALLSQFCVSIFARGGVPKNETVIK
jgi:hypothetical protein